MPYFLILLSLQLLLPVSPPFFSSSAPSRMKGVRLMASSHTGAFGNVGVGVSELSSLRLTAEKYLSAAFFLSPPFCFLCDADTSQLTPCLRGSRPKDELPFLLYLKHTQFQRTLRTWRLLIHSSEESQGVFPNRFDLICH